MSTPNRSLPHSPAPLFWAFSWMALQGFGGVLTVAQRELVERRGWLTPDEFLEDWALAQVLPGPNVCNLAVVFGGRCCGWRGAAAALLGLLSFPLLLLLGLLLAYQHWANWAPVAGALRGMMAVVVGLIAGACLKLAKPLLTHPMGPLWCAAVAATALLAIAWWRVPLMACVLGLGGLACLWTGWRLKRGSP
ncbi:MAG: chromate transporter [Ideonella sp.]|nr:chromate transporter [Ideonella sp.]